MDDKYTRPFVRKEDYAELIRRYGVEFTRNPPKGVLVQRAIDDIANLESLVLDMSTKLSLVDVEDVGRVEKILKSTAELDMALTKLKVAYGI